MSSQRDRPGQQTSRATQRPNNPALQRPTQGGQPPNPPGGNGGGKGRGGGGYRRNEDEPSPWLPNQLNEDPQPALTASFVEYLRWMRSPDHEYKDSTKIQILQMAQEWADYHERLAELTRRTRLIAHSGVCFEVNCAWRIRVGGHRGPESTLLPAFDATGMPYIPSSTLRGVARTQAIRELIRQENMDWKTAEQRLAPYFGSLDAKGSDRLGKVVFLDAYPVPSKTGGLMMDIATPMWQWQDGVPVYKSPNPNPFFSLHQPQFLIGLKLVDRYTDATILNQVKNWLMKGLQAGVGSQINTGYGELYQEERAKDGKFFNVEFSLKGQLVHGSQKFTNLNAPYQRERDGGLRRDRKGKLRTDVTAESEVRPTAFKSALRYWFRVFARGVLDADQVSNSLEPRLFGGIEPKEWGWIRVEIRDGRTLRESKSVKDPCGEQLGKLVLRFSPAAPQNKHAAIQRLFENLCWLTFHLGGVGQGARRPQYSRKNRQNAKPPWYRGSTLFPPEEDANWELPDTPEQFRDLFQQRLRNFYDALKELAELPQNSQLTLNRCGEVRRDRWVEVADRHCRIVVCQGETQTDKPYALAILHSQQFKKKNDKGVMDYDPDLCGTTNQTTRPSPVWISNLGDYQVVTVFGATEAPRSAYLSALRNSIPMFPLPRP